MFNPVWNVVFGVTFRNDRVIGGNVGKAFKARRRRAAAAVGLSAAIDVATTVRACACDNIGGWRQTCLRVMRPAEDLGVQRWRWAW